MPDHTVRQGEYLSRLAREHGFADFRTIWMHPNNASLRQKRANSHVLLPGDVLFIPDRELHEESRETENHHIFELKSQPLRLYLRFHHHSQEAIGDERYRVELNGSRYYPDDDYSKTDGTVMLKLQPKAENGLFRFEGIAMPFNTYLRLLIGHLDPVEAETGQRARLNNLGYFAGDPATSQSGTDATLAKQAAELRSALEEFQCDQTLPITGTANAATLEKLLTLHGC